MKKKIIVVVLILGAVILSAGIFLKVISENAMKETGTITKNISVVEKRDIENVVYLNGKVVTKSIRNISGDVSNIVDKIMVKVGDKIKKGDTLLKMNTDGYDSQLKTKKIQLEIENSKLKNINNNNDSSLTSNFKKAKITLNNTEKILNKKKAQLSVGAISEKDFQIAKDEYDKAQIDYDNASQSLNSSSRKNDLFVQQKNIEILKEEIAELEKKIKNCIIKSPIDGVITEQNAIIGEKCIDNLMKISNLDNKVIKANVSEVDINKIKIGQDVKITANSMKNKEISGKVSFISPDSKTVEGKKQAYVEIEIKINNEEPNLKNNFSVNMEIVIEAKENAKVVNVDAIKQDENGNEFINVIKPDGTSKQVFIKTGISNDVFVEVLNKEVKINDQINLNDVSSAEGEEELVMLF